MTRRNWYEELAPEEGEHPVAEEAMQHVRDSDAGRALGERIQVLRQHFEATLAPEQAARHRELLDAMTARHLLLNAAHYNLGVEVGHAQRLVDDTLGSGATGEAEPTAAIQALATEIVRLTERLRSAP